MRLLSQLKCAIYQLAQRLRNNQNKETNHLMRTEQRDIGVQVEIIRLPSGRTIMLVSQVDDDD